jgi:hypothetical protein
LGTHQPGQDSVFKIEKSTLLQLYKVMRIEEVIPRYKGIQSHGDHKDLFPLKSDHFLQTLLDLLKDFFQIFLASCLDIGARLVAHANTEKCQVGLVIVIGTSSSPKLGDSRSR